MRIEQLEYLAAVARVGSFRRAAEELHISQPALSETIRNLERELGVDLFDRRPSGATVSDEGRELLPHVLSVIEAVDRLRTAATDELQVSRMVRVGTVNAATVPLLTPVIQHFRTLHGSTQVEVVGARQQEIHRALREGSLDLGLVNYLEGDDTEPEFETTPLLRGQVTACVRADSPLAACAVVTVDDLLGHPLIVMRSGYAMNRYMHRLLGARTPSFSYSTDGAEMGKLMVAEGLGATVLPDYSVAGDPLERAGTITYRPLAAARTGVALVVQRQRSRSIPRAVLDLERLLVEQAEAYPEPAAASVST